MDFEFKLKEARTFAKERLTKFVREDSSKAFSGKYEAYMLEMVKRVLEKLYHWSTRRLEARWYIDVYKKKHDMDPLLLEFAALNFNMMRSHAQKYFLKVQKSGANEHLPLPRPKRKARHPYPQKAPKNALDSHSLVGNPPASSSSSSQNHASTKPVIQEQPGVSAAALPKNRCYSTSNKEVTPKLPAVTESNDDEQSCEKPRRVMPKFAQIYRFIESVFDPNTSGHLQRLKQMDPINMETVLLLMRNLSVNLTIPEFAEQRKLISS
ncbi:hypothetical protein Bca52824_029620 [Brassica carinata]|uniref:Uncharacterized protein n=1 Tax=Brassica carinata TaxID=52824 RepID=A0A8X7VEF2_BRACI|nr:hypothetical protein Bca52824_029620 [Brassica carinata]